MKKPDIERAATKYAAALLQQCELPEWAIEELGIDNTRDAAIFVNRLKRLGNELARRTAREGDEYTVANLNAMDKRPPEPL